MHINEDFIRIFMHTCLLELQGAGAQLLDREEDDDSNVIARYMPVPHAQSTEEVCT
jgi:hypothetical protein